MDTTLSGLAATLTQNVGLEWVWIPLMVSALVVVGWGLTPPMDVSQKQAAVVASDDFSQANEIISQFTKIFGATKVSDSTVPRIFGRRLRQSPGVFREFPSFRKFARA